MKKVIIFTNDDSHFYAHLLPIAIAAKAKWCDVIVLTNISKYHNQIEQHGLRVIPIPIKRHSLNFFSDLILLVKLIVILKEEKPDIMNNFTIKPIVYGTIAAFICNVPKVINVFLGLGYIFTDTSLITAAIRKAITQVLSFLSYFKQTLFIVQNQDDAKLLHHLNLAKKNFIVAQCSVGVEANKFEILPEPKGRVVFALVARMIIDKGIYEFMEAAQILKQKDLNAEFWLVGQPDNNNKQSISTSILQRYQQEGYIKYFGYQSNIRKIWEKAHVAVLPSYREGLSRSLLEAGGYGRSIITTDAPGGRELVQHLKNGLLVKPKDRESLAQAMELLITDSTLRTQLGVTIHRNVKEKYDASVIAEKMVGFYLKG